MLLKDIDVHSLYTGPDIDDMKLESIISDVTYHTTHTVISATIHLTNGQTISSQLFTLPMDHRSVYLDALDRLKKHIKTIEDEVI